MANKHGHTQIESAEKALLGPDHASTNGGALHSPRAATWTCTIHLYHAPSASTETPMPRSWLPHSSLAQLKLHWQNFTKPYSLATCGLRHLVARGAPLSARSHVRKLASENSPSVQPFPRCHEEVGSSGPQLQAPPTLRLVRMTFLSRSYSGSIDQRSRRNSARPKTLPDLRHTFRELFFALAMIAIVKSQLRDTA